MYFVGVDPGVTTGIVILNERMDVLETYSLTSMVHVDGWKSRIRRAVDLHRGLKIFLCEFTTNPELEAICLEGYSYGSRYQSHQLGELGFGYRRILLDRYELRTHIVAPKKAKKFLTGSGNASKKEVKLALELLGLKFSNAHLRDAGMLALCGMALSGYVEIFDRDRLKVLGIDVTK